MLLQVCLKDIPENSSMAFEWVAPFEIWFKQAEWAHRWGNNCLSTYVELKPGVNAASIRYKNCIILYKKENLLQLPALFYLV